MSNINKEYTYFEAMEEIIKDESKVFKNKKSIKTMYYDNNEKSVMITGITKDDTKHLPYLNIHWVDTKWTLAEEKKSYNVRVYDVDSGRLISSEIVKMIAEEVEGYCNRKIVFETVENCVYKDKEVSFVTKTINKTKIVSEEITT